MLLAKWILLLSPPVWYKVKLQCSSKKMILTKSVLTEIFNVAKYINICCENECEGVQRDDDRKGVHR